MINVTSKALINLCSKYQTKDSDLTFLGGGREDSDGIAYSYYLSGHKKVLKILAVDKQRRAELQALNDRLEFVYYLGTQGINIAYPEENSEKNLYATYEDGDHIYIAYSMKYCEGENPKTELLTSDLSYHWGKLIGKAHRITKNYPIWKNISGKSSEYGYTDEINFFYDWCKDEFVKSKWQEMSVTLSQLPITRNNYGFICAYHRLKRYIENPAHNDVDIYVIAIGTNDLLLPYLSSVSLLWSIQITPRVKMKKCISDDTLFETEYQKYIKLILSHNKRAIIVGLPLLQLKGYPNERVQKRNLIMKTIAADYGLPFIDTVLLQQQAFQDISFSYSWKHKNMIRVIEGIIMLILPFSKDWFSKFRRLELTVDGVHFNSLAAKLVGEAINNSVNTNC